MNRGVLRRTAAAALAVATTTTMLTAVAGASASATPSGAPTSHGFSAPGKAPVRHALAGKSTKSKVVKDRYIVRLKDTKASGAKVKAAASALSAATGGKVRRVFSHTLHGYSAQMTAKQAAKLRARADVASVVPVRTIVANDTQANPPSWGLDRMDQTGPAPDKKYTYPTTASNVTAYVIDSGMNLTHQDFGGRATSGYDFVDNDADATDTCTTGGHGTHVGGILGGTKYGVAKGVKLVAVRVLGCDTGTSDDVIAGVEWVTAQHAANPATPAVANMSLGGSCPPVPDPADPNCEADLAAVDAAVKASIASGVTYAVAAGNDGVDASQQSPARVPEAITVGASDNLDAEAYFSNYGDVVDIHAPGVAIPSDFIGSATATAVLDGTSMASPFVAGDAALVLSAHPDWTPEQVRDELVKNGVSGAVRAPDLSPTRLAHVGGAPATRYGVALYSYANGLFVTAESAGTKPLVARSDWPGAWERYDVVYQTGGFVAIKSKANGKWVTAESAGTKPLIARSTSVGAWEKFSVINNADGSLSYKANANGKYVSLDGASGQLIARASSIGSNERFSYLSGGPTVAIKASANGKYVTAQSAGANPLLARASTVGAWEKYDLVDLGGGWFALRAQANGKYVTAESAGTKPLIARSTSIGAWEAYNTWAYADNGARTIFANANSDPANSVFTAVTAESGGTKPLIANRRIQCNQSSCDYPWGLGLWEEFSISPV
ncbi:S8 family serine peptidase [Plantactinospora siamensis]|uniref:S8 family serine peptidase n=1 Tax=Plantactinospora siamensis TaxID=555372 RepID=A0ABV6NQY3_9ACTN